METYETGRAENMSGSRYITSRQSRLPEVSDGKKARRFRAYHRAQGLGVRTVVRTYKHIDRRWGLGREEKPLNFSSQGSAEAPTGASHWYGQFRAISRPSPLPEPPGQVIPLTGWRFFRQNRSVVWLYTKPGASVRALRGSEAVGDGNITHHQDWPLEKCKNREYLQYL